MTKRRLTVSLYVPAYNAATTLAECLAAVTRQTYRPVEVFLVDDGSTDPTPRIARRAGIRVIRHPDNRGLAAARNTAVRMARGELIAALDADLVAPPDWLANMVRNFEGRREIAGCCGRVVERHVQTIADRWRAVHMKLGFGMRRSYSPRWLYCGISLIRGDAIMKAGLFDERCRTAYDDVDLSRRLVAAGHTLLYDPTAVAWHLKRSRPGEVIRGFWSYWAAKNEMQGAYQSLTAARRLMIERQMGIAAYRIGQDLRHRRDELLPLDLLIPLTFCVRDIDTMVRIGSLEAPQAQAIQGRLVQECRAIWEQYLQGPHPQGLAQLAFADGHLPEARPTRLATPARGYLQAFQNAHRQTLADLAESSRQRISRRVPALLAEAGP